MRLIQGLILFILLSSGAKGDDSSVYSCQLLTNFPGNSSVRLKKYFDPVANMTLGKVDLLQNLIVVESTLTKVYQIPLTDNQTYVQFWHAEDLLVDAQLSYQQNNQKFSATYTKGTQKLYMMCSELSN